MNFKHAMGARDDAVVVRGRSARKLEAVVFLTNMDAIRDPAAQALLQDGWMTQEDLHRVVQECLREEGENMVADDAKRALIPVKPVAKANEEEEERTLIDKMGVFNGRGQGGAGSSRPVGLSPTRHPTSEPGGRTGPRRARRADTRAGHGDGGAQPCVGFQRELREGWRRHPGCGRHTPGLLPRQTRGRHLHRASRHNYDARTRARKCGKLKRCLYGTRQAARTWQRELEVGIKDANLKMEEFGLGASKPVDALVCTTAREMTDEEKVPLEGVAASQFRRLAAKLNNLSLDRSDIRFGTVCSVASKRRVGDMSWLLSITRFLVGKPLLWT